MIDKIVVALRVLTSMQNHTHPVSADVKLLQSWVDPVDRGARYDELACIVIGEEVQRRKNSRVMQAGGDNGLSV
jgi:hypothetical protein